MRSKLFFLLLIFAFASCKELYDDYQTELSDNYLVVEGMITDEPGPYYIKLSKALAYSNDLNLRKYRSQPERGAILTLRSDASEEVILHELSDSIPGTYATFADQLTGVVGRSYTLTIQTQGGDVYESLPTKLIQKPEIVNLYAESTVKKYLDESRSDGTYFLERPGMQLICDLKNSDAGNYIKIETHVITENTVSYDSIYFENTGNREPVYQTSDRQYCWTLGDKDPIPYIVGGNSNSGSLDLNSVPLEFVFERSSFSNADSQRILLPHVYYIGGVLPLVNGILQAVTIQTSIDYYYFIEVSAYCVDDNIYEYYRNLKNQVTAYNKIFDPIPAQLTGNIKCTSNEDKNIFGIFVAASIAREQFEVNWAGKYSKAYVTKKELYFPFKKGGCSDTIPPFWVDNTSLD